MNLKPYPEYKASGIEWLGAIPEDWEIYNLRRIAKIQTGNTPPKSEEQNYSSDGIPWVKPDDLGTFNPINDSKEKLSDEGSKRARIIPPKAVLVCCIGSVGKIGIAGIEVATNQQINSLIFNTRMDLDYSKYLIYSSGKEHQRLANGNVVFIINSETQGNIKLPVPSQEEQRSIAAFLDRETAKIDSLIAKKEKQIELIKEKRQALISHAVTKGLDPNVKMKDSGVEWLGEIPEHWEVQRLKYQSSVNDDTLSENEDPDCEIAYVDIGSVDSINGISNHEVLTFAKAPSRARRKVKNGDVIVSTVRTYLRAISPIVDPEPNLIVSTGFAVVRPKRKLTSRYAAYVLRAPFFVEAVVANSTGVSYPAINASDLIALSITLPSVAEQLAIASYLEYETAKIDTMTTKIKESIDKLREYRTALISAAVTGKIEVRGEG